MGRRIQTKSPVDGWSSAKYFTFIRSGLRKLWSKYPVKFAVKKQARRKSQSSNKRLKWEFQCKECSGWFPDKETTVDHITPCGTLKSYDDLPKFVERLLCDHTNLQVLCDKCHLLKSNNERSRKKA